MADFEWGMDRIREGTIRPLLDGALPLSQASEPHRLVATNQVTGNIVRLPRPV